MILSYQTIFLWSKKIHRVAMWGVIVLGIGMAGGGLVMHRELEGSSIPSSVDTMLIRYWHNKMASPFALFLVIMMITGLVMWAVPIILKRRTIKTKPQINE